MKNSIWAIFVKCGQSPILPLDSPGKVILFFQSQSLIIKKKKLNRNLKIFCKVQNGLK